ncbi:MAG: methyltransferase domain-containing protein [Rhodospirillales bacterium]
MPITATRLRNSIFGRYQKYLSRPLAQFIQLATRSRRIARYLVTTATPAVILGAGQQRRAGWLATDLQPGSFEVLYLDAGKRLPFGNDSLAFVFAEHMIEHVPHAVGSRLAAEVHRVLRPGGVFRVATPDLATIAQLVLPQLDERARKYIATSN